MVLLTNPQFMFSTKSFHLALSVLQPSTNKQILQHCIIKQLFHLHDKENDEDNDPSNKAEKTKEESFGSSLAVHPPIASPLLRIQSAIALKTVLS